MDSNRVRLASVREATLGTLPNTPRMRIARINGESLKHVPLFAQSAEIRSDRSSADPSKVNEKSDGGLSFELFYPQSLGAQSDWLSSALMNAWINTPEWDNDGTADSVITGEVSTTGTLTVVDQSGTGGFAGTSAKAGHLIRTTGFAASGNNVVAKVTSSTGTTIVVGSGKFASDDTTPAAAARVKVVGFEGASGDITATATGLGSTALDFTTLGLRVGQWIKVGGTAAGNKFATALLNDWIRITAISATALTCDNLPAGWTTDAGTGKTIRVFFGDVLPNGTTLLGNSMERAFLGQAAPTYILQEGMVPDTIEFDASSEQHIKVAMTFMGMSGSQGTSANGNSYAAAPTGVAMTSNVSLGRIAEAGAAIASPNWVKSLKLAIKNNLRQITADSNVGAVAIGVGECEVTGTLETYFGSNALLAKLLAGTISNVSARATQDSQAVILQVPRLTYTDGSPNAGAKNSDVTLPATYRASKDPVTGANVLIDRLEYFEA